MTKFKNYRNNSTTLFDEFIQKVDITFNLLINDFLVSYFREREMYEAIIQLMEIHKRLLKVFELSSDDLRDRYYNKLNESSKNLYAMIHIYNTLAEHSISVMHRPLKLDEIISIENTYIGVTESGEVDAFKRIIYKEPIAMNGNYNANSYNFGLLYKGLLTNNQAIYRLHKDTKWVETWAGCQAEELISSRRYPVNTEYLNILGRFGSLHAEMCQKQKVIMHYYMDGETTKEEIKRVIDYVEQNYDIKKYQKIKKNGL